MGVAKIKVAASMEDLPFVQKGDTWISLGVTKVKLQLTIDGLPFVKKGDIWTITNLK